MIAAMISVDGVLARWLSDALKDPGPFSLLALSGGNSNETLELRSPAARRILRRPPAEAIDPSAHAMGREHRILAALAPSEVPSPQPLALCDDPAVPGAPFLVMEAVDGAAVTVALPDDYPPGADGAQAIGAAVVDALATLHGAPWSALGLEGFGRPEGFLDRQVDRWSLQLDRYRVRDLPWHAEIGRWLEDNRPPEGEPGILHGDFHFDNCLMTRDAPIRVAAIIDWEMATIGDPLLDLGLFLGFWGPDRLVPRAMPRIQAVSACAGAPSRAELAARYAQRSGRSVEHLAWYMTLAFWKLATITEGAYAQFVAGTLTSHYARQLERDVPLLLHEAAGFAGLRR